MPKPINRMDAYGWQTPKLNRVLDPPPDTDGQTEYLHGLGSTIVKKFAALGIPVHLKDIDIAPSHTRYHLIPNGKRSVTEQEMQVALRKILPDLNVQAIQLLQLTPGDPTMTLMLRTATNRSLNLSELLEKPDFTQADSYSSIALGADMEQNAVVRDMSEINHLLIVGDSATRLHLQMAVALTLCLFNSPSYLRLALVGDPGSQLRHLSAGPHALGNMVTSVAGLRSMAEGLMKHALQRTKLLEKHGVDSVDTYSKLAANNASMKPLPRIVMLMDSVAIPNWRTSIDEWFLPMNELLSRGAAVGLHVVMTIPTLTRQNLPERLSAAFTQQVVMRSTLLQMGTSYSLPQTIPLEFVDAILLDSEQDHPPIGLELATVSEAETTRIIKVWEDLQTSRNALQERKGKPATTGNTGLLSLRKDIQPGPSTRLFMQSKEKLTVPESVISTAGALAAYVGWLSVGPLREVLELSSDEAEETLRVLLSMGILEPGEGPVWRFARLADFPPEK